MTVKSQTTFEKDILNTNDGPVEITFIGHGTVMLSFQGKVIHVDPWSQLADYSALPKADLILITHDHGDHLDVKAVAMIRKTNTEILCPEKCAASMEGAGVMKNGDKKKSGNILVEAVPAYNLVHKSQAGQVFHQKGEGNGYVITLGGKRIYVAGDTENTPEMKALKNIDAAFLPMNLPYTMTPAMVADAAGAFKPKILYPYHFGDTDTGQLLELMKDEKGIEIRLRKMK
jgi:L-ascorbate metabolism protein UlaG (beta-lactamase superfamily)